MSDPETGCTQAEIDAAWNQKMLEDEMRWRALEDILEAQKESEATRAEYDD